MDAETPDPTNDDAMRELHSWVGEWVGRHRFGPAKEIHYLALYLAGRCGMQVALADLKEKWKD